MNLASPDDPVTITNLPDDVNGNLIDSRSRPRRGIRRGDGVSESADRAGADLFQF